MATYEWPNATIYYSNGTSASNAVWGTWISLGNSSTTSISTSDTVWRDWNTNTIISYPSAGYAFPQRTPEEEAAAKADAARRMEEFKAAEAIRKAEEAEAKVKARIILEEHLSDEQRKQLADNAWFEVVTPKGTYRIRSGWSGNVERYVDGRATDRYCIHPGESVPHEDNMLAQKLLLEADEEAFLRIANRSTPYA